MDPLQFITTADGSKTIFHSEIGEHYHSVYGAVQESRHVFLESGLQHFLKQGAGKVSVLEVGFGTGLNFLVSAQYCLDNQTDLKYTGIEAFPLTQEMLSQSGYAKYVTKETWELFITKYEDALRNEILFSPSIQLEIVKLKVLDFESNNRFDVLYFDAFSMGAQPEMWTDKTLGHICQYLNSGGLFVTYAINGTLKHNMKTLGFSLEKISGAHGKREMLRATKVYRH